MRSKRPIFARSKALYEDALQGRNLVAAGRCLLAYQRGEDTPEAFAGAMLMGSLIIAQVNPKKGGS